MSRRVKVTGINTGRRLRGERGKRREEERVCLCVHACVFVRERERESLHCSHCITATFKASTTQNLAGVLCLDVAKMVTVYDESMFMPTLPALLPP